MLSTILNTTSNIIGMAIIGVDALIKELGGGDFIENVSQDAIMNIIPLDNKVNNVRFLEEYSKRVLPEYSKAIHDAFKVTRELLLSSFFNNELTKFKECFVRKNVAERIAFGLVGTLAMYEDDCFDHRDPFDDYIIETILLNSIGSENGFYEQKTLDVVYGDDDDDRPDSFDTDDFISMLKDEDTIDALLSLLNEELMDALQEKVPHLSNAHHVYKSMFALIPNFDGSTDVADLSGIKDAYDLPEVASVISNFLVALVHLFGELPESSKDIRAELNVLNSMLRNSSNASHRHIPAVVDIIESVLMEDDDYLLNIRKSCFSYSSDRFIDAVSSVSRGYSSVKIREPFIHVGHVIKYDSKSQSTLDDKPLRIEYKDTTKSSFNAPFLEAFNSFMKRPNGSKRMVEFELSNGTTLSYGEPFFLSYWKCRPSYYDFNFVEDDSSDDFVVGSKIAVTFDLD